MAWSDLKGDSWVSRANAQDGIDKGFFLVNNGVPATDPQKWITKSQAISYVTLDETAIPVGFADNRYLPVKYWVGQFPTIATEFDGLATPLGAVYDSVTGNIYFIDRDDSTAGVWYFNPETAQTKADFHIVPGTILTADSSSAIYPPRSMGMTDIVYYAGYIFVHGAYSGGMLVIECSTNTVVATITEGSNGDFQRQNMLLNGTNIWAYHLSGTAFSVINGDTQTVTGSFDISSVPGYSSHGSALPKVINGKLWILLTSSTAASIIRVYNNNVAIPNYTTDLVGSINDIDTITNYDGKLECTDMFWDEANGVVYVPSKGDNKVFVYDDTSYSLVGTIDLTMEGKTYSSLSGIIRTTTSQYYLTGILLDGATDTAQLFRTYELNRTTHVISNTLTDTKYSAMIYVSATGFNYTTIPGSGYPTSGYDTDGKILGLN